MAYEYDRFEREDGGGSFLMGLLAGTVLGAGLGMLFAPRPGAELRTQLTDQATCNMQDFCAFIDGACQIVIV